MKEEAEGLAVVGGRFDCIDCWHGGGEANVVDGKKEEDECFGVGSGVKKCVYEDKKGKGGGGAS